jgi:hypothetical protein
MIARYHMRKNGRMVESNSKTTLEWYRSELLKHWFKGARIRHIIQVWPDGFKTNRVYEINTGKQLFP